MDLEGFGEGSGRALDVKIEVFVAFSAHIAQDNIARNRYIIIHLFWLPFLMTSVSEGQGVCRVGDFNFCS